MDFPKCKICGERHRLGACPSLSSSRDPIRMRKSAVGLSVETDPATGGTAREASIARQTEEIDKPQSGKEHRPNPREAKLPFRRPLASERNKTLTAQKPWEAEGMSRRTWYRRKAGNVLDRS